VSYYKEIAKFYHAFQRTGLRGLNFETSSKNPIVYININTGHRQAFLFCIILLLAACGNSPGDVKTTDTTNQPSQALQQTSPRPVLTADSVIAS